MFSLRLRWWLPYFETRRLERKRKILSISPIPRPNPLTRAKNSDCKLKYRSFGTQAVFLWKEKTTTKITKRVRKSVCDFVFIYSDLSSKIEWKNFGRLSMKWMKNRQTAQPRDRSSLVSLYIESQSSQNYKNYIDRHTCYIFVFNKHTYIVKNLTDWLNFNLYSTSSRLPPYTNDLIDLFLECAHFAGLNQYSIYVFLKGFSSSLLSSSSLWLLLLPLR